MCSILPGKISTGSVEVVILGVNPELTSWCTWICRQKAQDKDRNLRERNIFPLSLALGGQGARVVTAGEA